MISLANQVEMKLKNYARKLQRFLAVSRKLSESVIVQPHVRVS